MSYSEKVLIELFEMMQAGNYDLFDAAVDYCEKHDLDVEDFANGLDKTAIERLKQSAVDARRVRTCVQPKTSKLV